MSPLRLTATQWIEEPSLVDGHLDGEDLARLMTGFRGQPLAWTPRTGGVRPANAGSSSAYVVDDESGMVYLLD